MMQGCLAVAMCSVALLQAPTISSARAAKRECAIIPDMTPTITIDDTRGTNRLGILSRVDCAFSQ